MAEALYRRYRPQVFEDVVGQEPIERTLKNAVSQDKVSHAYLFCGPRGTGKTTTARLLAKALLCDQGPTPEPDGTCESCELVAGGTHPDVSELDAASRTGVDNVREEIIGSVHFAPTRGRFKIYIIDEVHMLSVQAFNALLKTLEEPPDHVVFILCTTDPQKVPDTIHSRCQRFDFHGISAEAMVTRLGAICVSEGVEFEGEALDLIAQRAGGGLRDALTSLEQIIAFEDGKVTFAGAERLLGSIDSTDLAEIVAHIGKRDIASCFRWTARYFETGADLAQFTRDMAEHVRNLYVLALAGDDAELDVSETGRQELTAELAWFGPERSARMLGVLGDLMAELKTTSNPRLAFEIALTRMVRPDSDLTLEGIAERVEALEAGYSAVAHVVSEAPVAGGAASGSAGDIPSRARVESPREAGSGSEGPSGDSPKARAAAPAAEPAADAEVASSVSESKSARVEQPATSADAAGTSASLEGAGGVDGGASGASGAGAGSGSLFANPASLQRVWAAALAEVKKQKQAHGVLFMGAKARFDVAAGALVVAFPAESSFAFNAAQKPDVQDELAAALAHAAGEAVPFRFEQASEGGAAATNPVSQPANAAVSATPPSTDTQPVPEPQPAAEAAPAAEPHSAEPAFAADPAPASEPQPSAEQVPYDDVPYEEVPYEEFGAAPAASQAEPQSGPEPGPRNEAREASPQAKASQPSADSTEAEPARGVEAAPATPADDEGASALQDMLRASFGDGVVISEESD